MTREEKNKVSYVVMCAFLLARRQAIAPQESIRHLLDCGGIAFLDENYAIEHTLPLEDTIDALVVLCDRQG